MQQSALRLRARRVAAIALVSIIASCRDGALGSLAPPPLDSVQGGFARKSLRATVTAPLIYPNDGTYGWSFDGTADSIRSGAFTAADFKTPFLTATDPAATGWQWAQGEGPDQINAVKRTYAVSTTAVGPSFYLRLPSAQKRVYVRFLYQQTNPFNFDGIQSNVDSLGLVQFADQNQRLVFAADAAPGGGIIGSWNSNWTRQPHPPGAFNLNTVLGQWTCYEVMLDLTVRRQAHGSVWVNDSLALDNVISGRRVPSGSTTIASLRFDGNIHSMKSVSTARFTLVGVSSQRLGCPSSAPPPPPPPPPATASGLGLTTQPSSTAQSGIAFAQQPVVQLRDSAGNAVNQSGVVVTAVVASGGGTLMGTATRSTNSSGVAAFTDLAITGSGTQTLQFVASGLTSVTSNAINVTTASTSGGTVLFAENFEDTNFGARGWYDLPSGGITSLSSTDHIAGSAHSLQESFAQGGTSPSPRANGRHLFTPTDAVYVRYWVKHSTSWVGSGHTYHPHEFYILSTLDDQYAGPSYNFLTTYIEHNWMSDGGHPVLESQDSQNIDVTRINQDLTTTTENRAVSGCNGSPDNTLEITCYQIGSQWYNGKTWRSAQPAFVDAAGPNYKGDWHKVEAYFKLNSIVNGLAQRDGVAQCWVDGVLYVDRHDLQFRTGAHPTLQFNQLLLAPYIGDGSPVAQTLWYDDLVVMTGPPGP